MTALPSPPSPWEVSQPPDRELALENAAIKDVLSRKL